MCRPCGRRHVARAPAHVCSAVLLPVPLLHENASQSRLCVRAGSRDVFACALTLPARAIPAASPAANEDESTAAAG